MPFRLGGKHWFKGPQRTITEEEVNNGTMIGSDLDPEKVWFGWGGLTIAVEIECILSVTTHKCRGSMSQNSQNQIKETKCTSCCRQRSPSTQAEPQVWNWWSWKNVLFIFVPGGLARLGNDFISTSINLKLTHNSIHTQKHHLDYHILREAFMSKYDRNHDPPYMIHRAWGAETYARKPQGVLRDPYYNLWWAATLRSSFISFFKPNLHTPCLVISRTKCALILWACQVGIMRWKRLLTPVPFWLKIFFLSSHGRMISVSLRVITLGVCWCS